jgi:hypothetical protein
MRKGERHGAAGVRHRARVAWLDTHRDLWADVPGIDDDVDEAGHVRLTGVVEAMSGVGLFGQTPWGQRRETVRRLMTELRTGAARG